MTAWKNFGMTMVILVAGIQGIPRSFYEAAELDGASSARRFLSITIPLLVPTIGFCVITNTIGSLQVFDQIYVMTGGGPLFSTETLVLYIYDVGFKSQPFELSYASAIAVLLFLIIMAVSTAFRKYFTGKETVDL
jgi:multiple sugar transport system permease protein